MASIFCPFAILQAFHCCISNGSIAIGLLKPASVRWFLGWNVNGNVANRKPGITSKPPGKCHLMPNFSGDIKKNTPKMGGYDWFIKEDRHNQQPQESFCAMLRQLPTSLQKLDLAIDWCTLQSVQSDTCFPATLQKLWFQAVNTPFLEHRGWQRPIMQNLAHAMNRCSALGDFTMYLDESPPHHCHIDQGEEIQQWALSHLKWRGIGAQKNAKLRELEMQH